MDIIRVDRGGMVTEAEFAAVERECLRYRNQRPGLILHVSDGWIKEGDTFKKIFYVRAAREPYPFEMLVTREQSQADTPRAAFDKAMTILKSRTCAESSG